MQKRKSSPTPTTATGGGAAMPKRTKASMEPSMLPEDSPASVEILSGEKWKCLKQGMASVANVARPFALDYEVNITSATPVIQSLRFGDNELISQSKEFPNMFLLRNGINRVGIVVVRAGRIWLVESDMVNETVKENKEIELELNNTRLLRQTEENDVGVVQWEQMPSGAPLAFYIPAQGGTLSCTILL